MSAGQAALSGAAALMPQDVAARQAARAASVLPSDPWLLALLRRRSPAASAHAQQGPSEGAAGRGEEEAGAEVWELAGLFLDVSVRGGAVLDAAQVQARYPHALAPYARGGADASSSSSPEVGRLRLLSLST